MTEYLKHVLKGKEEADKVIEELEQKCKTLGIKLKYGRDFYKQLCGNLGDFTYVTYLAQQYKMYELKKVDE